MMPLPVDELSETANSPASGKSSGWAWPWSRPALGRIGFLAFATAMAIAILGVSWSNYGNVLVAANALNRSQALVFRIALERELRMGDSLTELIADHSEDGLRYVAAYNEQGRLFDQAGSPASEPPSVVSLDIPTDFQLAPMTQIGVRVRSIARSGPRRFGGPPSGYQPPPQPSSDGNVRPESRGPSASTPGPSAGLSRPRLTPQPPSGPRRERPAALLVEFEPVASTRLTAQALRTFTLSAIVAPALLGAGGLVWYLLRRREEYLLRLERQERLSALGEMAAVLAHEIRNPLASLKGHAQLLSERFDPEGPERHKADRIVKEATRLEKLTTSLLDFARSGSLTRAPHDPLHPLQAAIDTVGLAAIDVDASHAPARWSMDADALQQLLTNVLQNAVQATPNGEAVRVEVGVEDGSLVYRIRDRGPGVPHGLEQRIFEPFVTTRTRGVGLGLAVAQRIARLHGGAITVSTHSRGGALFRIAIPAQ
jgi:two-component system sensor histidine kinase HydH